MKKNRLILALLLLTTTLSAVSVSLSLAWYSASTRASINYVEIELNADKNLKISTSEDIDSFKEELTYEDLKMDTGVFKPISSLYRDTWMSNYQAYPDFFDSSFSYMSPTGVTTTPVIGGYFNRDLYILADDDVLVTIDPNQTYIESNLEKNIKYVDDNYYLLSKDYPDLTKEEMVERLNKLTSAMRYSILVPSVDNYDYAVIDPHKEEETIFAGTLDNNIDRYYDYTSFDDGNTKEILYGEVNDRNLAVYDDPLTTDIEVEGEPSAFNAGHAKNVYRFNLEKSIENGLEIAKENAYSLSDFRKAEKPFLISCKRNTVTKINLSIYIEGWDLDSVNYTMGAAFESKITFKIERREI